MIIKELIVFKPETFILCTLIVSLVTFTMHVLVWVIPFFVHDAVKNDNFDVVLATNN